MWGFVSSILRRKVHRENETNDSSSCNVGTEDNDLSEETFEDCLEEDPEVSSSSLQGYTAKKIATSSIYPPLSTIAAQVVPYRNSSDKERAEIPFANSVQHSGSVAPDDASHYRDAVRPVELSFRTSDNWNFTADISSSDISFAQDSWVESSGSTSLVLNQGLLECSPEDGHGSNASCAHVSNSQIRRVLTAITYDEGTLADRRNPDPGLWSCALSSSPRRVGNGRPLSSPVVLNERGSLANSCIAGFAVGPSPWRNVECGVRTGRSDAQHPVGEDWSSFDELLEATGQDDDRIATPPPQSISGAPGGSFLEEWSPNQTCYRSTADVLPSQISLGAFPLTNSPNCTVDRDSRQLSQLRFPRQRQGVNESSEKTAFDPVSSFDNISLDPQSEERRQRQSHGGRSVQWPQLTEHLSVLGKLDFPSKVFPVLAALRGTTLEESFTAEELHDLAGVPKQEVSQYLWYVDGLHGRPTTKRPPRRDAGTSSAFHCFVHSTGKVTFQIAEEMDQASTILQRVLGFDRVFKVYFEDLHQEHGRSGQRTRAQFETFHRLAEEGIFAGLRRYQYFGHKPSEKADQKSEGKVKCYFVCTESRAEADLQDSQFRQFSTIADIRCLFMHIHKTDSLSKYISRLQLVLSKTITMNLKWSVVTIEDLEDVRCKDASGYEGVCTDGTGYISRDLAKQIVTDVHKGRRLKKRSIIGARNEEYPSLLQVRFFQDGVARKGTLLANGELSPNTIRCYKSMKKVGRDERMNNYSLTSLELVSTSRRTRKAKMSQELIVLLSLCKVPESFFISHLTAAMEKSYMIFSDPRAALEELIDWESDKAELLTDMISAKISLQEPFLYKSLLDMSKSRLQDFSKGKFALDDTYHLMATADPTGTLKRNQVTITLSEGPLCSSKVLVYRALGKHPGDIHVFQATCTERLDALIGTGKFVIYFSTQGPRPITDEIGKGDLDGDRYWVCNNAQLVSNFQEWHCRWERKATKSVTSMRKPTDYTRHELERALFEEFLDARYNLKSQTGIIANRWLMHMDEHLNIKDEQSEKRRAHLEAALKLASPYYDSIDYAKTGIKPKKLPEERWPPRRPHHMEKNSKQRNGFGVDSESYESQSILGKIYDMAETAEHKWCLPTFDNFEVDVGFQIANYELHVKLWSEHFSSYRGEMESAMKAKPSGSRKSTDAEYIYLKYRKILYGGVSSFKEAEVLGKKERQLILEEASAIYTVVYQAGRGYVARNWQPRLTFAWNVAGEALCEIYSKSQPGRSLHMSYGLFKELYGRDRSNHQDPLSSELF